MDKMNELESRIFQKLQSKERLTESEILALFWEYGEEVYEEKGDNKRWTRPVTIVVKFHNKHYLLNFEEALTEMQDDYFYEQPYEVEPYEHEKTIIVTEWRKI